MRQAQQLAQQLLKAAAVGPGEGRVGGLIEGQLHHHQVRLLAFGGRGQRARPP